MTKSTQLWYKVYDKNGTTAYRTWGPARLTDVIKIQMVLETASKNPKKSGVYSMSNATNVPPQPPLLKIEVPLGETYLIL